MGYTVSANSQTLEEKWYVVDAAGQVLGRVASDIAHVLRGKHLPSYTPHANMKAHVIVLNADKVVLTGDKVTTKKYYWHSNYPGGIKSATPEQLFAKKPTEVLRIAVQGMIPKNRLGRQLLKNMRLLTAGEHPHLAQKPEPLPVRNARAAK